LLAKKFEATLSLRTFPITKSNDFAFFVSEEVRSDFVASNFSHNKIKRFGFVRESRDKVRIEIGTISIKLSSAFFVSVRLCLTEERRDKVSSFSHASLKKTTKSFGSVKLRLTAFFENPNRLIFLASLKKKAKSFRFCKDKG
jgi:hypothetical protein